MRRNKNLNALPSIRVEMRDEKELSKEGKTALRFIVRMAGEKKVVRSTGLYVKPEFWDKKKMRAIPKSQELIVLNAKLSGKITAFEDYFTKLFVNRDRISRDDVIDYFNDKRFDNFLMYFEAFKEENKKRLKPSTYNKYRYCKDAVEEYAKRKRIKELKFIDIDRSFIEGFHKFLLYDKNGGMTSFSADNYHKVLKKLLRDAMSRNIIDRFPYDAVILEKKGELKEKDTLTVEEIVAIKNLDFTDKEWNMRKSRDLFLFMLHTGLRISDVRNAKWADLKSNEEKKQFYLDIIQEKTNVPLPVFLTIEAIDVIVRIRTDRNVKEKEKLFGKIVDQNVNEHLKVIAKRAGINKHLSTHVGRHTLATLLYNEKQIDMNGISGVLGQKSVNVTRNYVRKDNSIVMKAIEDLYATEKVA